MHLAVCSLHTSTSLATTAAPFWSWLAVATQRGLRRQNDVKISKFRVLGQQIACDYRYSRLINVVEQTATASRTGVDGARAWLRMCRKRHRMRRQAFCSFSPLLIGTFPIEARVCFGCLSFQLRDGTVRKQLKCTRNRTNKQTCNFPPSHFPPLLLMGSNYNKVDKRRAVRAARREEVGDRGCRNERVSF